MKPKLILHAGVHKTGTTAIQSFCRNHIDELRNRGVFYPDYSPLSVYLRDGHHDFAHAFSDNQKKSLHVDSVEELLIAWRDIAVRDNVKVLLSAEALCRHFVSGEKYFEGRKKYLQRIASALCPFDVQVVLVFRRPDNYIRSYYQELVAKLPKEMAAFSKWRLSPQRYGLNYFEIAEQFRSEFNDVTCLLYEDLARDKSLVTSFLEALDVEAKGLPDAIIVRESLNAQQTLVKNYANRYLESRQHSRKFVHWLRLQSTKRIISQHFEVDGTDLWESYKERLEFLNSRQEDLEKLRLTYFPERKVLFDALTQEEIKPFVGALPGKLAAIVDDWFLE